MCENTLNLCLNTLLSTVQPNSSVVSFHRRIFVFTWSHLFPVKGSIHAYLPDYQLNPVEWFLYEHISIWSVKNRKLKITCIIFFIDLLPFFILLAPAMWQTFGPVYSLPSNHRGPWLRCSWQGQVDVESWITTHLQIQSRSLTCSHPTATGIKHSQLGNLTPH